MTTRPRVTGGCQCGAVRYALTGPLERPSICHCRMCQKAFGSFFAPLVSVMLSDFTLTRGALAVFRSSDRVERGFCRDCGTPLSFRHVEGEKIDVSIGSLDDPNLAKPIIQFGTEARLAWVGELASLPGRATEEDDPIGPGRNRQHPDHDTELWPPEGPR